MKKASPYIAAGLFLAAVIARIVLPPDKTEKTAVPVSAVEEKAAAEEPSPEREVTIVTINAGEYLGDTAPRSELPEAVEQAVETFWDAQAEYEDMGVPANVSYDVPSLGIPYVRPVLARVSSSFGYRVHPLENLTRFHYGTDLAALSGDDICCFAAGTVREVGRDDENGRYIRIDHPNGISTMYAHCGDIYVREGQNVGMGEKIALVGISGQVTGPVLHFELTKDGTYLNPEFYLAAL